MHVFAAGDKPRANRWLPLRERVKSIRAKSVGKRAVPSPGLHASACSACSPRSPTRREGAAAARHQPSLPACGTITTMRLSPHSPYHTARTIDPGAFARFTIDSGSTRASLRAAAMLASNLFAPYLLIEAPFRFP